MTSTRTKLYTFGCSYTVEEYTHTVSGDVSFPRWHELLSEHLHLEYKNFGVSGAGNDQIFQHAINQIINNHEDIKTVAILWSGIFRFWIYGMNFNPNTTYRRGQARVDSLDWYYSMIEGSVFHSMLKGFRYPTQASEYQITVFVQNIITLQKLCKHYNIKLTQWCGPNLLNIVYKGDWDGLVKQYNKITLKYDIDDTNIIGWPFVSELGGNSFFDINKGMTISPLDSHPNAKGHELIARYFYENTKCESKR